MVIMQVGWGESTMIQAERLLLRAALENPANRRFVLLSDRYIYLHFHTVIIVWFCGKGLDMMTFVF